MPAINPILKPFFTTKARYHILYGGRASSKSYGVAGAIIGWAHNYTIRVVCCRQFLNKSQNSIYTLLKSVIYSEGLQRDFEIQATRIISKRTGSEIFFFGLYRYIDEVKSMEGIDIALLEEAHNLTQEQYEILDGTFRKKGFTFMIVFNPRLATDFVWKRFVVNPPKSSIVRKINYDENPYLDEDYIENVINEMKREDPEGYEHHFLGMPLTDDANSIISRSHVMAAIDAHIKLGIKVTGQHRIGFDVADGGDTNSESHDSCAIVVAHGSLTIGLDHWKAKEDDLLRSCNRAYGEAKNYGATLIYDAHGVGAFVGSKINDINKQSGGRVNHKKFLAGGKVSRGESFYRGTKVKRKDYFTNEKAATWWDVADRLRNTYNAVTNGQKFRDDEMIFIDADLPYLEKLIDELCEPKRVYDNAGRLIVERKKDLKKRGISSPDLADSFIMAHSNITTGAIF
jgi:phage terminase large subunit